MSDQDKIKALSQPNTIRTITPEQIDQLLIQASDAIGQAEGILKKIKDGVDPGMDLEGTRQKVSALLSKLDSVSSDLEQI